MARILFGLIISTAAMAQATILPSLGVLGVMPDLVLVLLFLWSALRGIGEGAAWVFGTGLLLDLLALDPLGTNGLALLAAALLAGQARRRIFHSGLVVPILAILAATMVHGLVLLLLRSSSGMEQPIGAAFRLVFLQALLNALFVPPFYLVVSRMDRWVVQASG